MDTVLTIYLYGSFKDKNASWKSNRMDSKKIMRMVISHNTSWQPFDIIIRKKACMIVYQNTLFVLLSRHLMPYHYLVKNSDCLYKARSPVRTVDVSVGYTFRCGSIQHLTITGINSHMIDYTIIVGIEKY